MKSYSIEYIDEIQRNPARRLHQQLWGLRGQRHLLNTTWHSVVSMSVRTFSVSATYRTPGSSLPHGWWSTLRSWTGWQLAIAHGLRLSVAAFALVLWLSCDGVLAPHSTSLHSTTTRHGTLKLLKSYASDRGVSGWVNTYATVLVTNKGRVLDVHCLAQWNIFRYAKSGMMISNLFSALATSHSKKSCRFSTMLSHPHSHAELSH